MRAARKVLRLRNAGGKTKVTYKGEPEVSRHKSREELELEVSDSGAMQAIFERLGYQPTFRYEKYRTELRKTGNRGVATIDETQVGTFVELEGSPDWIDRTAGILGYQESDYITASYGRLYLEWCERKGVAPGDMLMPRARPKSKQIRFK